MVRTTARSWLTNTSARLRRSRRSSSRPSTWACTVTSSAVVGSSHSSTSGSEASADGDHDALAHAAGELVRVVAGAPAASRMPTSPSSSTARSHAARRESPPTRRRSRRPARRPGGTGVERAERVLEDHREAAAARRPRVARRPSGISCRRAAPGPASTRTAGGVSAMIARSVRLLPLPDSPTIPIERPPSTANDTPSTTRQRRWRSPTRDDEVANLERRRGHCGRSRSASPSPTSDRLRPVSTTAIPGTWPASSAW